jgi:sugar lactone lactonase YvrE
MITTVVGNGHPGSSGDGGMATDAELNGPLSLAVDGAGNLFIADYKDNRVRKVTPDGMITTVATTSDTGNVLAVDSAGNLFITDHYRVRKIDAATGMITTVAGNNQIQSYAGDGILATATGFRDPRGLAIDAEGNLFIAESGAFPGGGPYDERVLKVFGVAAPGLLAGMPFPMPKQP